MGSYRAFSDKMFKYDKNVTLASAWDFGLAWTAFAMYEN